MSCCPQNWKRLQKNHRFSLSLSLSFQGQVNIKTIIQDETKIYEYIRRWPQSTVHMLSESLRQRKAEKEQEQELSQTERLLQSTYHRR